MGQNPTPPAAPKKNIGEPFKGGDRVLDRNEIVAEVGHRGTGRGVTLREERDRFQSPGAYQRMTRDMIERPASTTTVRSVDDRLVQDVPVADRFVSTSKAAQRSRQTQSPRASTRAVSGRRR